MKFVISVLLFTFALSEKYNLESLEKGKRGDDFRVWVYFNDKSFTQKIHISNEALERRKKHSIQSDNLKQDRLISKLEKEIISLKDHKCHSCGQDIHDEKQISILRDKEEQLGDARNTVITNTTQQAEWQQVIDELGELGQMPVTHYNTLQEALEHQNTLNNLNSEATRIQSETDTYRVSPTTVRRCPMA